MPHRNDRSNQMGLRPECWGAAPNEKRNSFGRSETLPHIRRRSREADVDDKFNPIEIRPATRLIVFSGLRNEKDGDDGAHFYQFENGRSVHIRSVLKPGQ